MTSLTVTRTVRKAECPWLSADVEQGRTVYLYTDHTYGCITPAGVAVTNHPGEIPFFELPKDALA